MKASKFYVQFSFPVFWLPFLFILSSCTKEENPVNSDNEKFVDDIKSVVVEFQESHYGNFENLLLQMDTTAAMNSIAQQISTNENVDWVETGTQGISIQYKNGVRGGLFINPKDVGTSPINNPSGIRKNRENCNNSQIKNVVPVSKKVVLINPHFSERVQYTNELIEYYNIWFPDAGYDAPIIYKGNEATLDLFASLSNFGVIHIYSHGWAWPSETMTDVYVQTGERWTATQLLNYIEDYKAKLLLIGTSKDGSYFYFSSKFFVNKNDFTNKNTLIYGGFCYSFEGRWLWDMEAEKIGGYIGFDWSVFTNKNQEWAKDLFFVLLDKSSPEPTTVGEWLQNPIPPKKYFDQQDNREVSLNYVGNVSANDLALLEKAEINWPWRYVSIVFNNVDVICNVSTGGTYTWNDLFFSHPQQYTSILPDGVTFIAEWDTIYSGGSTEVGQLSITVDTLTYMVTHFQATKYYEYKSGGVTTMNQSLEIEGQNISMTWKDEETLTNNIDGSNACNAVYHFNFIYTNNIGKPTEYTYTLDTYNCDEGTYISIYWDVDHF
jgi:hypothetical protein